MRIWENCVNSEDLKKDAGADTIFFYYQGGYGPYLMKGNDTIGFIDMHIMYLGDDIVIKEVIIYDDKKLGKKLTEKYKHKILITSQARDNVS